MFSLIGEMSTVRSFLLKIFQKKSLENRIYREKDKKIYRKNSVSWKKGIDPTINTVRHIIFEILQTPPLPIEEIELAKLTADYEKRKAERMQRKEKNLEDINKNGHANGNSYYANGHNVYRRRSGKFQFVENE